jgi:hypothetical protein
MTVEASAAGYVTDTARLVLSEQTTADFALRRSADPPPSAVSLAGVVTESTAPFAPVPSARASVTAGPQTGRSVTTDAQGRYQIDGLSPEPLTIEISALGYLTQTRTLTPRTGEAADFRLELADQAARTSGRVVDILTGDGLEGIAITGEGVAPAASGADGVFRVTAAAGSAASRPFEFTGADVVTRRTWLHVPEESDVAISLIPNGFDQRAFDEMLRAPMLRRWTAAPPLVIERRALEFTNVDMTEAVAATDSMAEVDAQSLLADLEWALPQLTGGRFGDFNLVAWQTAQPGATVGLLNSGVITVVRVKGLADSTGAWGWSRWLYGGNGIVVGGLVMLDEAFERSGSPYLRSLRAHELGHALGYTHVSGTLSVMNADGRVEPTPFDHGATRIAFDRPPGNRAPDVDPEPAQFVQRASAPRWSDPVR